MTTYNAIKQINKYIRQGTLGNLPGSDLLYFWIQIPKRKEQDEFVKRIQSVNMIIKNEQKYLSKYQKLKQGLMQDLLTGKKEVTPDPEDYESG